jgi:hypothetical protein
LQQELDNIKSKRAEIRTNIASLPPDSNLRKHLEITFEETLMQEQALTQALETRKAHMLQITDQLQNGTLSATPEGATIVANLRKLFAGTVDAEQGLGLVVGSIDEEHKKKIFHDLTDKFGAEEVSHWKKILEQWGPKFVFVFLLLLQQSIGQMGKGVT